MLQRSARFQYALLALVAFLGLVHVVLGIQNSLHNLLHGTERVEIPFAITESARAIRLTPAQARIASVPEGFVLITISAVDGRIPNSTIRAGDAIYSIDGQPFTSAVAMARQLAAHRPGQTATIAFWRAGTSLDRPPVVAAIPLPAERSGPTPVWAGALQLVFTLLPVFCLVTGWYVVFARPRNPSAWLMLGILGYISALLIHPAYDNSPLLPFSLLWGAFGQTAMPVCFMLFGIYFPERARSDVRFPWIKWIVIVPTLLLIPADLLELFGIVYRFSLVASLHPGLHTLNILENILASVGIFYAFFSLHYKIHDPAFPPDARRRVSVLTTGSSIGLTPLLILVIAAVVRHSSIDAAVPRWLELTILGLLFVFPLTLAYVVIVQRAMDVRILIRQGTKYFFAKQSTWIVGALLAAWMSYEISLAIAHHGHRSALDVTRLLVIAAIFFVYRRIGVKRMQAWIDQRFFREAYSTEQLLSELSDDARTFTEIEPLLETITLRLSATLHIERIAVFLRSGESFRLQFATGLPVSPGAIPALAASSITITHLTRGKTAPATVYPNDPSSWLVDATDAERTVLADLSTELLVPLPGRKRLAGVIALGPKSSEEPYSRTDRQLLQSVASQTGLALENAELLESLTAELAQRASMQREIAIAREVQERLFPQTYPHVPGVGLCGFCRPAHFVGGDYYDFFLIPAAGASRARLAIAIGDISGKGISAALLMASLRASLRSVATLHQPGGPGSLATLMQHVNHLVYEASTANRYATFFYAELDLTTRLLTYVNAGHNSPVVLRPRGSPVQLEPTGTVVGLLPDAAYDQATVQLQSGETLLAFTDGISEAMTAEDEEWGEARMTAAAQRLSTEPGCTCTARQLLDCLLAEADAFTAGAPQHDDMTLLVCTIA